MALKAFTILDLIHFLADVPGGWCWASIRNDSSDGHMLAGQIYGIQNSQRIIARDQLVKMHRRQDWNDARLNTELNDAHDIRFGELGDGFVRSSFKFEGPPERFLIWANTEYKWSPPRWR